MIEKELLNKMRGTLSDFIDEEFPKGHEERGAAITYIALYIAWLGKRADE